MKLFLVRTVNYSVGYQLYLVNGLTSERAKDKILLEEHWYISECTEILPVEEYNLAILIDSMIDR